MTDAPKVDALMGRGRGYRLWGSGAKRPGLVATDSTKSGLNHICADSSEKIYWGGMAPGPPRTGKGRGGNLVEDQRRLMIPANYIGLVIGKAGTKIRELREESGANIYIPRDNSGSEVEVKLSGTDEQMNQAQDLIEQLTQTGKYKIVITYKYGDLSSASLENSDGTFWGSANYGAPVEQKSGVDSEPKDEQIDWGAALRECNAAQKVKWAKLPDLIKNFYQEHPDVAVMSEEVVRNFRLRNNNIEVSNYTEDDKTALLKPITRFSQAFQNYPDILATITKQGFDRPSPIQCQAWPYLLSGKDCIGIAQTGTGKTLTFLMPAFIHIDKQPTPRGRRGGPNVLVLSPTRELALQIAQEFKKYEYHGIKSVCIYGGGSRKDQCKVVTAGVEIIIATPGRLNDLVDAGFIAVESITYLVLDEADRMLDMGFEPEIRKILVDIRPDRQTVMTSATWPEGVRRLANSYMTNPVTVFIGSLDLAAVHSVTQRIEKVQDEEKLPYLLDFIRTMEPDDKIIVFVMRKSRCDDIASELAMNNITCQAIHGDREQSDREQALQDLRTGEVKILIATDVASRGIDIEDVTHVLNYDFPKNIEDYVHRVGRTGRAGKKGQSLSLWAKEDWRHAPELVPIMEEANQEIPEWLVGESVRYVAWKQRKDNEKRATYTVAGVHPLGGGRGRRSGGRGVDGCFKCGETGHFSRECPKAGDGRGRRGGGGKAKW